MSLSVLPLLFLEKPEARPAPLCQAVRQISSAGLPPLQETLPSEPEQVAVRGTAIRGRSEFLDYLIRCKECTGALENRQNVGFGHNWQPSFIRSKEEEASVDLSLASV